MTKERTIEVFSAGCPVCDDAVQLVHSMSCEACEVVVLDTHKVDVARRAKSLGIRSVPAVVIDGKLTSCCSGGGVDEGTLRAAGLDCQATP